jgi:glucose/arabinose dehydrogenase
MPNTCVIFRKILGYCCIALAVLLAGCGGGDRDGNPDVLSALRLQQVGPNLGLNFPLFLTAPTGDTARLFVVEKGGVIKIINMATQQTLPTPFLDLTGQIETADEQGMLGLAFHPSYNLNGFFYINVTNLSGDSEIRRYQVSAADPNVADPASVLLVLSVDQPAGQTNHKAGWLGFGRDGFLYAAFGDGGGIGDPGENAQDLNSLLGKILRIDVNADDFLADATRNYAIPPTNPFIGAGGGLDEIWSYGLRNPWRPSFDRGTGDFYIADVGQDRREEVNVATLSSGAGAGANFGWDTVEGSLCFEPAVGCITGGLTMPVLEYDRGQGQSITGGYVYRGGAIAGLQGTYFYADFVSGFVRTFRFANGIATEQTDLAALRPPGGGITSFGEDAAGELYIVTAAGGVFRIVQ